MRLGFHSMVGWLGIGGLVVQSHSSSLEEGLCIR
jgi:hypothetical protein